MSRHAGLDGRRRASFPRVSGDEPFGLTPDPWQNLFSPRERG